VAQDGAGEQRVVTAIADDAFVFSPGLVERAAVAFEQRRQNFRGRAQRRFGAVRSGGCEKRMQHHAADDLRERGGIGG